MTRVNKSWMALVAAALLLGTLVAVVWARPNDRPQGADITRKVTLTGAEFIVGGAGQQWSTDGNTVSCVTGSCYFVAPVVFPCLPSVTVERIRLHVLDGNGSAKAIATFWRDTPPTGSNRFYQSAVSPVGTTVGTQTFDSSPINAVVWPSQGAVVSLEIGGPGIFVFGVTVEYHRNI